MKRHADYIWVRTLNIVNGQPENYVVFLVILGSDGHHKLSAFLDYAATRTSDRAVQKTPA